MLLDPLLSHFYFFLFLNIDLAVISFLIRDVMSSLLFPQTIPFFKRATVFKLFFVITDFRDPISPD